MPTLKTPVGPEDHIRGDASARITLVEYGDYECPHCRTAHGIVRSVERYFDGDMRFVFRHFPLTEMHPHAEMAAEAAELAGAHGRFWEMHDLIYENQQRLSATTLAELCLNLGIAVNELQRALQNGLYQSRVRQDFMSGVKSGVHGTPSFFINGERYNGTYDFESLVEAIGEIAAAA